MAKKTPTRVPYLSHLRALGFDPERMSGVTMRRYRERMASARREYGVWTVLDNEPSPKEAPRKRRKEKA